MIVFEKVSKAYQRNNTSVHDIDFKIKKGEFITFIGPSGAGKTTLLRLLLAEEKPTSGAVYFDGVNIHNLRRSDLPKYRQRIGVVFQDYKLLENKTVYENVAFAMEMIGKNDSEIKADVPHALELVGLENKGFSFPEQLSGGEQQRLAIARAIINQPDVLVADEPTGSLDPEGSQGVLSILKKINELGTTVILATHDRDVVNSLKRRVVRIE
jgi:cell division transport system ATP-binding protein